MTNRRVLGPAEAGITAVTAVIIITPLIALIICQLILMLPIAYLEGLAGRLL